jgi:hypothetical protein
MLAVRFSYFLTIALSLLLSACNQQQVKPLKDTDQLQLAEQLLSETVYINTLFDQCASLGNDIELQAINLQQDWLQKNWPLVAAADNYYSSQLRPSGFLYNGQLLSLEATLLAHQARQKAIEELNFAQRAHANKERSCNLRLQNLAAQEIDLSSRLPRKSRGFDLSAEQHTRVQIDRIPELAYKETNLTDPGRSWFPLEAAFREECAQVEKLVLFNEWPREAYAVYCNGRPLALMVCDWGECARKTE